jgi:ADP-ribose pyrophosphatase YjhB (NUDIX family)
MKVKNKLNLNFLFKIKKHNFSHISKNQIIIEKSKLNQYRGIEFDLEQIISHDEKSNYLESFNKILDHSLETWDKEHIRSITVRIPSYLSHYISFFMDRDFYFHHTNENNLYLCKWLDKHSQDKIPRFAHHHVGVAACIMNKNLEILLIKEKFGPSYANQQTKKRLWKFVTGLIEEGESLVEACHREVKEEVYMDVNYHGCLVISESYPNYQKISDICFFNLCSVKEGRDLVDFKNVKYDPEELSEAKFFKIEEIQKLIEQNETTLLTISTMNKLIPMIDYKKSLEENLKIIEERGVIRKNEIDVSKRNFTSKYLNVYH